MITLSIFCAGAQLFQTCVEYYDYPKRGMTFQYDGRKYMVVPFIGTMIYVKRVCDVVGATKWAPTSPDHCYKTYMTGV